MRTSSNLNPTVPNQAEMGSRRRGLSPKLVILAIATTVSLAACGKVDRLATVSSTVPFDYRERHPIVMTNEPRTIEIYPGAAGLTNQDKARLADLAASHRRNGQGPILVETPAGRMASADRYVRQVRAALADSGATGNLRIGSYHAPEPERAAPIRVSYLGLAARVATRCGEWPEDLASASSLDGWNNKPYWNLGCAYQNMLAVQTADPRDLAGPRGESPSDVAMRMRAIDKVRSGDDPGTKWQVQNSNISEGGVN